MLVECRSPDCSTQFDHAAAACPACGTPAPAVEVPAAAPASPFNVTRGLTLFLLFAAPAWYWALSGGPMQAWVVACLLTFVAAAFSLRSVSARNVAAGTASSVVSHNLGHRAGRRVLESLEEPAGSPTPPAPHDRTR